MITRARAVITGLAALAALSLVVAGLPLVLYRFGGSPLPRHFAGWHRIVAVLSERDSGILLLAIIRDCSWLAWLLFTVSVLAEAHAAIRGRRAPHLRLGGIQGAAAQLVALAALAFATPQAITLTASVTAVSQSGAGTQVGAGSRVGAGQMGGGQSLGSGLPDDGGASAAAPPQGREIVTMTASQHTAVPPMTTYLGAPATEPAALDASAATATRLITVRSGDCLWSIAQRYLGAGDRYADIARLNYGLNMGDGQVFTNPSLIEPGWHLFLPGSAADGQASQQKAVSQHPGHATKDRHYRRRHPAARVGAPGPAGPVNPASPVANAAAGVGAAAHSGYQTSASAGSTADELPEAAVFGTGALAGAVLTSLTGLRRRQRQERRRGRRIALPADPDVLAAEQRLRAAAPNAPLETLRDALACLEAGIVGGGRELPDVVGLHVTPDVLEVLLAAPAADAPPAPYAISPGRQGMCWQLDLPAIVTVPGGPGSGTGLAGVPCHLLPGLITAGATATGYLLLDLEALQVTGCDGPPGLIDQVVATTATELATGQWSGWYDLILVGCDELEVLGRAEHCPSLDVALELIEARCAAVAPRVAEHAPADVRELRLADPDNEDWGLTILISRVEPSPEQMTRLLELAEDGPGGIAALVAGDPEAAGGRMAPTVLQLAPDPQVPDGIIANVVPLQVTVRPRTLSTADYDSIATLLAVAADLDDVGQDAMPYAVYGAPPWIPQAAAMAPRAGAANPLRSGDEGSGDPAGTGQPGTESDARSPEAWHGDAGHAGPWLAESRDAGTRHPEPASRPRHAGAQRVEVKILGPFVISGAPDQLQPRQAELVLALALAAPAGLSNSALCSMLGADPDHPKPTDAVRQIITRTRRRLGSASDGQEYIIHAGSGQYILHPDALLDWTQFCALVASGRADDLRAAVSLINGQPFTGSYFWWIDIPLVESIRAELVDAADRLAEFELATGSARAAARAARAGLMADSSAEQLWRAVMRAEHAQGNLAGVTEAWRRCLDAIEDVAPGGEPHPDTEALYRQLTMATGTVAARQHVPVR